MKYIFSAGLLILVTVSISGVSYAQEAELEISPANEAGYRRAGIALANLSALVMTTKERAFAIVHPGRGETSRLLNRRRLACIKRQFGTSFSPERVTLAEGEPVEGLARVELYLGSKLMHVALIARHANLCQPFRRR